MDIKQMMKQAQELQEKMSRAQDELGNKEITATAGGNMVEITLNGKGVAKKVKIDPSLLQEDQSMLEDLMVAAINNAKNKLENLVNEEMQSLGLSPDMFKMPM